MNVSGGSEETFTTSTLSRAVLLAQELGCNTLLGMAIVVMGAYLGSQSTKGTCLSECYSSVMAQEIGPSIRAFAHRAWNPPTSSSLADEKPRLLPPPHPGGARLATLTP